MIILKKNLSQMILVGLLFAVILGIISFNLKNTIFSPDKKQEKQVIIIDVNFKSKLSQLMDRLNQTGYLNRNLMLSNEFSKALDYTKLKYVSNKLLEFGCLNFSKEITDGSIIVYTISYEKSDKKLMDQCLNELFNFSFKRFKEKLNIYQFKQVSFNKLEDDNNNLGENNEGKKKDYIKFSDTLCEDLDANLKENKLSLTADLSNQLSKLENVFNMYNNLMFIETLEGFCNKKSIEKKNKFLSTLNSFNNIVEDTKFEDAFKIEIIQLESKSNEYLSTKIIVLTFSLFGFIFGALLFYNLRSFKN